MSKTTRKIIKNKGAVTLCRVSTAESSKPIVEKFEILSYMAEGGSSVCYKAKRNGYEGTLKEFYPLESSSACTGFSLARGKDNNLYVTNSEHAELFEAMKSDCLRSYELLLKERKNNALINNFVPSFELYEGYDEESGKTTGSVYVWTIFDKKTLCFEDYIKQVREEPNVQPEHKLFNIISTVITLSRAVCILHRANLIHMDIKPRNFGVTFLDESVINFNSISLYDVNSVLVNGEVSADLMVTKGYTAPEVKNGSISPLCDIYSIGALLFNSVVVTKDVIKNGYNDKMYSKIDKFVDESSLIGACDFAGKIYFKSLITRVLKKCLAINKNSRYMGCEELVNDLMRVQVFLAPAEYKTALDVEEGYDIKVSVIKKISDKLDDKKQMDFDLGIQYLLMKKPLYEYLPFDSKVLNVVVMGFGSVSQSFVDACLQFGQIPNKYINITVVTDSVERDRDLYLSPRPALKDFITIDSPTPISSMWGNISFVEGVFSATEDKKNKKLLSEIHNKTGDIHYVFVALGEDEFNHNIAKMSVNEFSKGDTGCSVNFAWMGKRFKSAAKIKGTPVYISSNVRDEYDFKDVERMAFNNHLVWFSKVGVDISKLYADFKKPYHYYSSISNALSVRYKLYGAGIVAADPYIAASEYYDFINDPANKDIVNQLIACEHRRWTMNLVTDGWTCMRNIAESLECGRRDEKRKKHICIVKSRSENPLSDDYPPGKAWDTLTPAQLASYDELDMVSVKYHQVFLKKTEELKNAGILNGNIISEIELLAGKNEQTEIAFAEWFYCLKAILNADASQCAVYESLKGEFLEKAENLCKDDYKELKKLVGIINSDFQPILTSMAYVDFKRNDEKLVRSASFILTYNPSLEVCIPFTSGNNSKVFSNIASANVINPERITYLCYIDEEKDIKEIQSGINNICTFIDKRNLQSKANIYLCCSCEKLFDKTKELCTALRGMNRRIIKTVKTVFATSGRGIASQLLMEFKASKMIFEVNDTYISALLEGAGFYEKAPRYEFDSRNKEFNCVNGCEFLRYINAFDYIRVSDMLTFENSTNSGCTQPEFYADYDWLWSMYKLNGSTRAWNRTCELLAAYANEKDLLASFIFETNPTPYEVYTFVLPANCRKTARKIIDFLANEAKVVAKKSTVSYCTSDSCKVTVSASPKHRTALGLVFCNPYNLMNEDSISMYIRGRSAEVRFNNLMVRNLSITGDYEFFKKDEELILNMLRNLSEKNYITNYRSNVVDGVTRINFTYPTEQIKHLLTNSGRVLEVYTYHKAIASGGFDDVVSSYEINWNGTEVKNELDCIVTRGYRSLFIECKAKKNIDQDFYYKLSVLTKKLGINATAVLIADTMEGEEENAVNGVQRIRGDLFDVITISDESEIENIGEVLLSVINGEYKKEQ